MRKLISYGAVAIVSAAGGSAITILGVREAIKHFAPLVTKNMTPEGMRQLKEDVTLKHIELDFEYPDRPAWSAKLGRAVSKAIVPPINHP